MIKGHMKPGEIAAQIGCSVRTIYREIQRGQCSTIEYKTFKWQSEYSAHVAQKAVTRQRPSVLPKLVVDTSLAEMLCYLISQRKYSPAAAVQELRFQGFSCSVSVKTVYRSIYKGILKVKASDLPVGRYRVKPQHILKYTSKRHLNDRSIDDRPGTREDFGHWELDTVIGKAAGKQKCLAVLTERKTRFEVIRLLDGKTVQAVYDSLIKIRSDNQQVTDLVFQSLACDNGTEFSDSAALEQLAPTYYCHPYHSWERGSNENQNKLIRRFIPKGKSMNQLTEKDIVKLQTWMNNYPRQLLGWQRPADLFAQELANLGITHFIL